jgi:hypothetical protein
MRMIYLSHPYRADPGRNLVMATAWLGALRAELHDVVIVAEWILWAMAQRGPETPEVRRLALAHCKEVIGRCDAILQLGEPAAVAASSGMAEERAHAEATGRGMIDAVGASFPETVSLVRALCPAHTPAPALTGKEIAV